VVIFGTSSELIFDVNLIVQIGLLVLLVIGRLSKAQLRRHGFIMTIGTVTNLVTILLIMGPSLIRNLPALVTPPVTLGTIITVAHVVLGFAAIIGGLLFSLRFALALSAQQPLACGKRWMMRTELMLWLVALLFGIGFYGFYYLMLH
jgi:hypothetical protein